MTEPGATSVGAIVGYLRLNRDDWTAGIEEARRQAASLGRSNPDIRITTNAGAASAELATVAAQERRVNTEAAAAKKPVVSLIGAIAALAPAALPIASVAGGALIGLVPTLATVTLGVAGIRAEMKNGSLDGTRYGRDLHQIGNEADRLKTIAAGGLLSGIDRGLATSRPLFHQVNGDVRLMSDQIGNVVAGAGPALLRILTDLNPLFLTFGQLIGRGAHELEHWANTSDGVSHFVGYVRAELPTVMHFLGELITFFGHLASAAAPFGGAMLSDITLFAGALAHIPVGVLQAAIPAAISLYAAIKTYQGLTYIVNGLNAALTRMKAPFAATPAAAEAAQLATSAAVKRQAATDAQAAADIARAEADKVEAMQATAREAAAWGAAYTEVTDEVVADARAQAVAMQTTADAAIAAAAEMEASATTAAETVAAEGSTAAIGWTAMLGPLAAVGIGVALFSQSLGTNTKAAEQNQTIMSGYADSLRQSSDALAAVNTKQTIKNLQDDKSLSLLAQLKASNDAVGVSQSDLVLAVNGSRQSYDELEATLQRVALANSRLVEVSNARGGVVGTMRVYNATGQTALNLAKNIDTLRASFTAQQRQQMLATKIEREAQAQADGTASAVTQQARALGLTRNAYLDAQLAAKKNTEQTRQQTAAFQVEGDVAGLLQQALNGLAGRHLALATAATSLDSANLQVVSSLKSSKGSLDSNTQAGLAAQQAIQGQVNSLIQYAGIVGKQTHSTDAANEALATQKQRLEDSLRQQNLLTPAVQHYIDKLASVKRFGDYLNTHPITPKVDTSEALQKINELAARLSGLSVPLAISQGSKLPNRIPGRASGGGAPEGLYWTGEGGPELNYKRGSDVQVIPAGPSRTLADAIGIRVPGFAAGTSNAARIWDYLLRAGLSPREDAGVMGNLERESGFDPTASNGTHFGIAQWDAGRWANVVAIANRMGVSQWTLAPQLENLVRELHGPYRSVLTAMNHARSAARAAGIFNHQFEVSGDYGGVRAGYAADLLQRFRGTGPGAGGGGTGGGGGTRKQHPLHDARAGFRSTQHPHQVFAADGQWWYNGQSYATRALADEAKREDQITRGEQTVQRTIRKGGATGIAQLIRSQIPDSQQAMRDLGKAVDAAFDLKHVKTEIADARSELHNMLGYRGQVESTYAGMFDPTQYGTIGGLVKGLMGAAGANNGIAAEISKLRHEHLNKAYLSKLVSSGDTSTIALLAGGSQAQINQVDKALGKYGSSLTRIGNSAVLQRFDESVVRERHEITHLLGKQGRLMDKIERLTDAVTRLDKRPTIIELDGQPIYRSTNRKLAKKLHRHRGRHG